MDKKITIDDIFSDDDFGLLDSKASVSNIKTSDDRLIDSFEEISAFVDKNGREPNTSSMTEYSLLAKLKVVRLDDAKKIALKPFDRHNLLGDVEMPVLDVDSILNDDQYGLLGDGDDLDIFKLRNVPKSSDRAETDIVAQRTPMQEKDFIEYEEMFQQVHRDIKAGKRVLRPMKDVEKQLYPNRFYVIDGVLLYLKEVSRTRDNVEHLSESTSRRKDGRTVTIFENGTRSSMLYRSLGKQIQKSGRVVSEIGEHSKNTLFGNVDALSEGDNKTGWIYVVKSKSKNVAIAEIKDLYKIGFSTVPVKERVAKADSEATYLYADVDIVASYACYNMNTLKFEQLLQRFFAKVCLNVDVFAEDGQRITPREWFIVPLDVINEAIQMIINGSIVDYVYDSKRKQIMLK